MPRISTINEKFLFNAKASDGSFAKYFLLGYDLLRKIDCIIYNSIYNIIFITFHNFENALQEYLIRSYGIFWFVNVLPKVIEINKFQYSAFIVYAGKNKGEREKGQERITKIIIPRQYFDIRLNSPFSFLSWNMFLIRQTLFLVFFSWIFLFLEKTG